MDWNETAAAPDAVRTTEAVDFCSLDAPVSPRPGAPSADLYCIDLIARPDLSETAGGVAQLAPAPSPFGTAVTRDGVHRFNTTLFIDGLPDPATLGDFSTYIAWAAPPNLAPLTKLGAVSNGRFATGEVALNKFYLLISAESSDTVTDRRGPIVLRGLSPSTRMRDPHFIASSSNDAAHDHGVRDAGWSMPPHDPRAPMAPMGIEHLAPQVSPFLPASADTAAVPMARPRELLHVRDGDVIALTAQLVRRTLKGREILMYGFNGQYPGPLIHVPQAATITVDFHNATVHETAVHWHGVRLDNRFDGVPHVTQEPVPPGGTFRYTIHFPDAGVYWYHPHVREDYGLDMGLYGSLVVVPAEADYWAPVNREVVITLDDVLIEDGQIAPFHHAGPTHVAMGRFGNVMLTGGETDLSLEASTGEVVRFYLTNTANTRIFNVALPGARMKLVGGDSGRYEHETFVDEVLLAPSERAILDVLFDAPGPVSLEHRTP
ncbi:MAG: multicopper oxidase family protein, partial [Longimicrobiales bacterium]